MRAIFISYRRDDTEGQAGRLFQVLRESFGPEYVFMDVATMKPGVDFRRVIEKSTASCGVLLALIGRNWLAATNAAGKRRLEDPNDFVRLETAAALKRDIPVIPVLVQGARMPTPDELPPDLQDLAFRNGVELTHARWDSDVALLVDALRPYVEQPDLVDDGAPGSTAGPGAQPRSPTLDGERRQPPPTASVPSAAVPVRSAPQAERRRSPLPLAAAAVVVAAVAVGGYAALGGGMGPAGGDPQRGAAPDPAAGAGAARRQADAERQQQQQQQQRQQEADRAASAAQAARAESAAAEAEAARRAIAEKERDRAAEAERDRRQRDRAAQAERGRQQRADEATRAQAAAEKAAAEKAAAEKAASEKAAADEAARRQSATQAAARRQAELRAKAAQIQAHNNGVCIEGYVWRDARPGDRVCVTPERRAQVARSNANAAANREPGGGAYGANTCRQGLVWRDAYPGDFVCVPPGGRAEAARDNAAAASRVVPLPP